MHLVLGIHVGICLSILNEMIVMKIINYLVIYWWWKENFDLATRCRYNSVPSGLPLCVIPISPEGLSSFPINCMISIFINRIMTRKKTRFSLNLRWLFPIWYNDAARRGGAEVVGWTLDRKIRVRFPAYPHRVWALWWQGGKRCRGRLGTLKTPSCPLRGCPEAGQIWKLDICPVTI